MYWEGFGNVVLLAGSLLLGIYFASTFLQTVDKPMRTRDLIVMRVLAFILSTFFLAIALYIYYF